MVSVRIPNINPTTGPKYHPNTINGTQAIDIDKENGAIRMVSKPRTILKANKIAIKNNKRTDLKDLIGEKGKKNFFTLNFEFFVSF
ncbi:MAG: hypothetical protein MJ201_02025 [Mycoplasmoidaceae bacterium]|nr:hypothetical protein [Mycoplasmoidaceae bacterium]